MYALTSNCCDVIGFRIFISKFNQNKIAPCCVTQYCMRDTYSSAGIPQEKGLVRFLFKVSINGEFVFLKIVLLSYATFHLGLHFLP